MNETTTHTNKIIIYSLFLSQKDNSGITTSAHKVLHTVDGISKSFYAISVHPKLSEMLYFKA